MQTLFGSWNSQYHLDSLAPIQRGVSEAWSQAFRQMREGPMVIALTQFM